jgi:excisionase family DNA binding protein
MTSDLLTVPQFAAELHVTSACVRRWIIERRVAIVKLGRLVRIPESEAARMVEEGFRPALNRVPHAKG